MSVGVCTFFAPEKPTNLPLLFCCGKIFFYLKLLRANLILNTTVDRLFVFSSQTVRLYRLDSWQFRVFWDILPCSQIYVDRRSRGMCCLHQRPEDRGSTYLWNFGWHLFDYTAVYPRRLWTSTRRRENLKSQIDIWRSQRVWTIISCPNKVRLLSTVLLFLQVRLFLKWCEITYNSAANKLWVSGF
jgi:hypothetical protein